MTEFKGTTAVEAVTEAARLVGGDRGRTHGNKHDNFTKIGRIWNAYLRNSNPAHVALSPDQVADMMELMKVARRQSGEFNPDDYVDGAGYAGVAFEVRVEEHRLKDSIKAALDDWATRPFEGPLSGATLVAMNEEPA